MSLSAYSEARQAAKHGHPVIPCYAPFEGVCSCRKGKACRDPGKHPLTAHGLTDATTDPQALERWHKQYPDANWALVCSRVSVIDIDPRHGADPDEVLDRFALDDHPIVWTGVSEKGIAGAHVYCAAGTPTKPSATLPGVAVRGNGAYVMLAGSEHVSGVQYEWANGHRPWGATLRAVPHELTQREDRDLTIYEGTRDVDLTSLAGKLRYANLTPDELLDALLVLNERCDPPLTDDQVAKIARSIGDRSTGVDQELVRLRNREEAKRLYRAERSRTLRTVEFQPVDLTGADDLAKPLVDVKYAIESLHVDMGNIVLIAQFKTGKTTLVMNLQRSLTDDEYFLDAFDIKPLEGTVAFSNYELTENMRREWMVAMNFRSPERLVPPFDVRGKRMPFWDDEYRKLLTEYFATKDVEWWIVDTAQRASAGFITDWNSNDQVDLFLGLLDEIKDEAGIANLLLTHHQGRQQFGKDEERGRGAARLEDWGDSLWYLTRTESRRSLRASGRDVDVEAIDLEYDQRDRTYYHTGLTRDERSSEDGVHRVVAILAALNDHNEYPNTKEFKEHWKGNRNQTYGYFKEALKEGYIEQTPAEKGTGKVCSVTDAGYQLLRTVKIR